MSYLKVFAIGRLGKDVPDLRYTKTGTAVAEFSIACNEKYQEKERVEWVDVVVFGKIAESCQQFLAKGSEVFVEGAPRTEKYKNRLGIEVSKTKVFAHRVQFLRAAGAHTAAAPDDNFDGWEPGENG